MKHFIYTILFAALFTGNVFAQAPEKISYQAVIRNTSNQLVVNQGIGMQISILQGSPGGTAVYVETQSLTTNANGLASLEIGSGIPISGNLSTINWGNDIYFIKIETDPTATAGTNYTITGTSQLLSVPYALYAKTADSVTNDQVNDADADPTNEYNTTIVLNGTDLETTDGGGTIVTDLSSLQDGVNDADADPTNELITSAALNGNNLEITDNGGTKSVNLSGFKSDFTMDVINVFTVSATTEYVANLNFVMIYTNTVNGDLVIENPSTYSGTLRVSVDINGTVTTYQISSGSTQTISSAPGGYLKILVNTYQAHDKALMFNGHNMNNGGIAGMLFYKQ